MEAQEVSIRRAEPSDAIGITEVRIATWNATYSTILDADFLASQTVEEGSRKLRQVLEEEAQLPDPKPFRLVACFGTEVVGFAIGRAKLDAPFEGEWFLQALYILPSAQGLGIGSKLVSRMKQEGRMRGASRMVLQVFTENIEAQKFYRKTQAQNLGQGNFEIGGKGYPVDIFSYSLAGSAG